MQEQLVAADDAGNQGGQAFGRSRRKAEQCLDFLLQVLLRIGWHLPTLRIASHLIDSFKAGLKLFDRLNGAVGPFCLDLPLLAVF
jgi:hypothetical protein